MGKTFLWLVLSQPVMINNPRIMLYIYMWCAACDQENRRELLRAQAPFMELVATFHAMNTPSLFVLRLLRGDPRGSPK